MNVNMLTQAMRERANLIEGPDYVPDPDAGETPEILADEIVALDEAIAILERHGY